MTVHLIKLCVGADSVEHLADWQTRQRAARQAAGLPAWPVHHTRQTPKRAAELLDGGSLYWVVKGLVLVRQAIVGLEPAVDEAGVACCEIQFDPTLVATEPSPRKAFQGWRYLEPAAAPADAKRALAPGLPERLKRELLAIGAW